MSDSKPIIEPSNDGIYPRCVWCNGEIYGPSVIAYSQGEAPCSAISGCGKLVPESHIKLEVEDE